MRTGTRTQGSRYSCGFILAAVSARPATWCAHIGREPVRKGAPISFPDRESMEVGEDRVCVLVGKVDLRPSACSSRGSNRPWTGCCHRPPVRAGDSQTQLERARSCRSDALENLCASARYHLTLRPDGLRGPCYGGGSLADGSPGPDHGPPAIRRPGPRGGECDATLRDANAASQIIGNCRTRARRAADENPAEISSRGVDVQDFQDGTPLTLPK